MLKISQQLLQQFSCNLANKQTNTIKTNTLSAVAGTR